VDGHDEEAELHKIPPGGSRVNMRAYSLLISMPIYLPCLSCYCITPQAGPRRQPDMLIQLQRFLKNESGAAAIEYGLLASGISVAIIPAVKDVGVKLVNVFTILQNAV
jgi:pilus assembly protein Flp/PilA